MWYCQISQRAVPNPLKSSMWCNAANHHIETWDRCGCVGHRKKGGIYLSFRILARIPLHDGKCAKSEQFAERIHLKQLPIIHSLSEVRDRSSQVFLVDGVICSIQHGLDGINGFSDVCLELRVLGLLAQFL